MPFEEKLKIENIFDKKRLKEEKTTILECGHQFHEKCIIEWLKTQNKCPICRINVKYDNNINKKNIENNVNERSRLINTYDDYLISDIIGDIVDVQRDAYPHYLNEAQRNRIISDYKEENTKNNNNSFYDNDKDFDDFNEGSGGATSDW